MRYWEESGFGVAPRASGFTERQGWMLLLRWRLLTASLHRS